MRVASVLVFVVLLVPGMGSAADAADNPSLTANEQGIDDTDKRSDALRIESLDVRMEVVGALVDTTVTVQFANPSGTRLEGRFAMDLPPQAVVTGYALDVNGS